MIFRLTLLATALAATGATASAQQGIQCSAFLHQADGSWRSFDEGVVLGPRGPIQVASGERFSRGDHAAKADIARALDGLCLGQ